MHGFPSRTTPKTPPPQVSALKSAGCKRVFEDKASGGRWDRPELHRLLDQLRAGDTLVVWKLDRLSRSLKDLLHILERVEERRAMLVEAQWFGVELVRYERQFSRPRRQGREACAREAAAPWPDLHGPGVYVDGRRRQA